VASDQGKKQGGKHRDPAFKTDVKRWMSEPKQQSVAQVSKEVEIHIVTLCTWRKAWRLQG